MKHVVVWMLAVWAGTFLAAGIFALSTALFGEWGQDDREAFRDHILGVAVLITIGALLGGVAKWVAA